MALFFHVRSRTFPGPYNLQFQCPVCHQDAGGDGFEIREELLLFYVLPVLTLRNTYVQCADCGAQLRSLLKLQELEQHADADLSLYVSHQVSIVLKFLALVSLLLCWLPAVGLLMSVLTYAVTRKEGGWVRRLTKISLAVSLVVTVGLLLLLFLGKILGW